MGKGRWFGTLGAIILALTWLSRASVAVAQPLPLSEPEPVGDAGVPVMHTVTLRGASAGAIWEIYGAEGPIEQQRPLARCGERGCVLKMRTGKYRLWVDSVTGAGPHGYRELRVNTDLDLTVTAPSRAAKGGGLTLAILGKVGFVTGMTLTALGAAGMCDCPMGEYCDCESDQGMVSAGLITMLGSAIAIPVGWVIFARNRHPRIEQNMPAMRVDPSSSPEVADPPVTTGLVRLGPVRLGTGYGVGSSVSF